MSRILLIACLVVSVTSCQQPQEDSAAPLERTTAFENGLWYDGEDFVAGARYAIGGTLSTKPPTRIDSVVDLGGRHVVPPYGEGHTHLLEADAIEAYVQHYLERGVFYAKVQSGVPWIRRQIEPRLNQPDSFDFVSANQGFTGPGGHPLQIIQLCQQLGWLPSDWTEEQVHREAVFVLATEDDLEESWQLFLAGKPDFVKVFLHYSEAHSSRRDDPQFLFRRGLDPALLAPIVERARGAGLEVSVHGFTAVDFRTALDAGADHFVHFPGIGYDEDLGESHFILTDVDAERAATVGMTVTTTIADMVGDPTDLDDPTRGYIERIVRPNFERLRSAGVSILIGTDKPRQTSDVEASLLVDLSLMSPREALHSWSVATPRHVFPRRKIGKLDDGFEASFLVLEGNPHDDFANTQRIHLRVKRGRTVTPQVVEFPPFPGS